MKKKKKKQERWPPNVLLVCVLLVMWIGAKVTIRKHNIRFNKAWHSVGFYLENRVVYMGKLCEVVKVKKGTYFLL